MNAAPMPSEEQANAPAVTLNPWTSADGAGGFRESRWLAFAIGMVPEVDAWCGRAAALLIAHAADQVALTELLALVFHYDAQEILARVETHEVLARYAARDVLQHLTLLLLDKAPLNSERFKEVFAALKKQLKLPEREMLYPIQLALAGRTSDG